MGKRKKSSQKPGGPRKKYTLATTFQCLFCNHDDSVGVKILKKHGVGNLSCKLCGVTFQAPVNYLSAPVDVYAAWIDACDDEAEAAAKGGERVIPEPTSVPTVFRPHDGPARKAKTVGGDREEDEYGGGYEADGFVVDDEEDEGRDYIDDDDLD